MVRLHFKKANNLAQLHDEFIAAGVQPQAVEGSDADVWVTIDDKDEAAVNSIVAAHARRAPQPRPNRQALLLAIEAAPNLATIKTALVAYLRATNTD